MRDLSDPSSILGVGGLIHFEDGDELDIAELEREISGGVKETPRELFKSELDNINNELDFLPRKKINEIKYPAPRSLDEFTSDVPKTSSKFNENLFMDTDFPVPKSVKFSSPDVSDDESPKKQKERNKSDVVNRALREINTTNISTDDIDICNENEDEEKIYLMTEIETYIELLKDERISYDNVVIPNKNSSIQEIRSAHERLRLKIDYNRSCVLAEELLISGAYILEGIFNGKRNFLGKTPNLTGWSTTVAVKSKGLRHDMSSFVNKTFRYYNWGPVARLAAELIPSMIMYSSMQASKNTDDFYSSHEMRQAFDNVREIEEGK